MIGKRLIMKKILLAVFVALRCAISLQAESPKLVAFDSIKADGIGHKLQDAMVLDRCVMPKTEPTALTQAGGFSTMDRCAITGNGNLMLTLEGGPERIVECVGKTDFWMDRFDNQDWQSANVLVGKITIGIPAMAGAQFRQITDLRLAEIRTTLAKGNAAVEIQTLAPHEADNFIINVIANRGTNVLQIEIENFTEPHSRPEIKFEIESGTDGDIGWIKRKTHKPEQHEEFGSGAFRMWAAMATRVWSDGVPSVTAAREHDARATLSFSIQAGKTALVVTKAHSTGIPITMEPEDPLPAAIAALKKTSNSDFEKLIADHRAWWDAYWHKSLVKLDAEPVIERTWYGGLYVLGCGNKVGQWPAGCNSWPVDDHVPWGGDYHWNYNNEAPYYGAYSANHVEMTEPYDRTVLAANEFGKAQAKKNGVPGTYFFMATAPGHLNEPITVGQRTHALEASLNLINRYYTTHDLDWAAKMFPFFKDVAAYWDFDLQKNKETLPNGNYRYVMVKSAPMEQAGNDEFNGITGLAFLRRFYSAMIDITRELNAAGRSTGFGDADIARWQDYLSHLSEYPMSFAYGRKVFAWSEQTLNPLLTEQDWILYPVFPGEQVGLGSAPSLLRIARNTLIIKPQYYSEWLNNTPQIFTIAARLAHHPPEIIERFRTYFSDMGVNCFKSGGGNFEDAGIVESVNSFLMQSHEGFIRLFPCWPHPDAKFITLRANGAFLVSAELKNGVCQPVTVFSEKDRTCSFLNPWKQKPEVRDQKAAVRIEVAEKPFGQVCSFETEAGKMYEISPAGGVPVSKPNWNAALYKTATASSNLKPKNEEKNWDVSKLTDGTRINTKAGHRGWSSELHDDANHAEWVQFDLGESITINRVDLWPLDHGDAWQHTHCSMPFVISSEIDQSYDGFPVDCRVLISTDGTTWEEIAKHEKMRPPAIGEPTSDLKPAEVTGPESFSFTPRPARFVKIEATKLRKTRYFGKYALQFAEVEIHRASPL